VIPPLEEEIECSIRILGININYSDDLNVRIDGKTVFSLGRHRTGNGNTVYELSSEEFRHRIKAALND